MKKADPKSFAQAVAVDQHIRSGVAAVARGLDADIYLHRSLKPLLEVDLRTSEDVGQLSMFGNECEGLCGV